MEGQEVPERAARGRILLASERRERLQAAREERLRFVVLAQREERPSEHALGLRQGRVRRRQHAPVDLERVRQGRGRVAGIELEEREGRLGLLVGEWRSGSPAFLHHNLQRYSPQGANLGVLTDLVLGPLDFLVDRRGRLLIASSGAIEVLDATTGAFLDSMSHPGVQNLMALELMPR